MHKHQRGFTLVEAGTTMLIIATLSAVALPSFDHWTQRRQVEGVASELAADLQYVRTQAVAINRPLRVSFSTLESGGSCYVIHTGPAASCRCGSTTPTACDTEGTALKTVAPTPGRATIQANVRSIVYDPGYGTSSPAATVRVTGPNGLAIHHVVNLLGRVRTCVPEGTLGGYRAC